MSMPDGQPPALLVCVQCGFTYAEFRARGLLGCAACYDHMGDALLADMLQMHPRLHRRPPGGRDDGSPREARDDAAATAALRERLSDAVRLERYEEAAAVRRQLDVLAGDAPRPSVIPGAAP